MSVLLFMGRIQGSKQRKNNKKWYIILDTGEIWEGIPECDATFVDTLGSGYLEEIR